MASDPNIDKQICGKGSSANSGKGTKGHCNSSNVATGTVDIEKTDLGFESVLGERPQYRGGSGLVGSFGYSFGDFGLQFDVSEREFRVDSAGYRVRSNAEYFAFTTVAQVTKGAKRYRKEGSSTGYLGENPGVRVGTAVASACYSGARSVNGGLYTCVGVGLAAVDLWGGRGIVRPVLSGKVGIEFRVVKGLKIFSELFYEGMGEVRGQAKVITSSWKGSTSVVHTRTKVGYWGNVSGMRYEF